MVVLHNVLNGLVIDLKDSVIDPKDSAIDLKDSATVLIKVDQIRMIIAVNKTNITVAKDLDQIGAIIAVKKTEDLDHRVQKQTNLGKDV